MYNKNEEILAFLVDLRQNNNREWFHANKARYDAAIQAFRELTDELIRRISLFDPEIAMARLEAKDCIFRIYRDTRFSHDKSPYKTHMGTCIALGGKCSPRSGYYLHLEPGASMLAAGVWNPEPALLKKLRRDIHDQYDEFEAIMTEPSFHAVYPGLSGETLKRVPAGFPADAPSADAIRHKDFCVYANRPDSFFLAEDWLEQTVEAFKLLIPFNRFLNYTVDEHLGRE